jgi:hypothetical protein
MRRPGSDPDHLAMTDILCDFCRREWTEERPMVEGHQGSCICGPCLTTAYRATVLDEAPATPGSGARCALCLEDRADPMWDSPVEPGTRACRRCVRQSAAVLQKDPDSRWRRPEP